MGVEWSVVQCRFRGLDGFLDLSCEGEEFAFGGLAHGDAGARPSGEVHCGEQHTRRRAGGGQRRGHGDAGCSGSGLAKKSGDPEVLLLHGEYHLPFIMRRVKTPTPCD